MSTKSLSTLASNVAEAAVQGAGHLSTTAQVAIGTLPLLAALAFGIVVAVLSVIAFLQMTARDRGKGSLAGHQNEPGEADEFSAESDDWKAVEEDGHSLDWTTEAAAADNGMEKDEANDELAGETGNKTENEPVAALADVGGSSSFDDTARLTLPPALMSDTACPDWETNGVPRVCGLEGTFAGTCFRLNGSGLSIGRDPAQCELVFPLSAGEVSRKHCTLWFNEDKRLFVLEDHDSSNGTFLQNGERLKPQRTYELRSGERFVLSGHHHWFEVRDGE